MRSNSLLKKLILSLVLLSTACSIFSPLVVFADPPKTIASNFTPEEEARSYLYYNSLSKCFSGGGGQWLPSNNIITQDGANKGAWLSQDINIERPTIGFYITGSDLSNITVVKGVTTQELDRVECGKGANKGVAWILDAIKLWGYKDGVEALCDFGAQRTSGAKDCLGATKSPLTGNLSCFDLPGGDPIHCKILDYTKFQTAIKNKVYGRGNPSLSPTATYILHRNAFYAGCLGTNSPSVYTGPDDPDFTYDISVVDMKTGNKNVVKYPGVEKKSEDIYYMVSSSYNNVAMSCGDLAASMEANVDKWAEYVADSLAGGLLPSTGAGAGSTAGGSGTSSTCGSVVSGTGWFLCPIMQSLAGLGDLMWSIVQNLLIINPLNQSDPIHEAWGTIRGIANVLFVIFFLIIIFSQLTGAGITNYGIKKLLPKIIICAILVNISFVIIQIAVDISNIAGKSLYDVIMGMANKLPTPAGFGSLFTEAVAASASAAAFGIAAAVVGTGGAVMWLLAPSILMSVLALFAALITLTIRQAAIPILAILAPLAFVAYLLPNTEQWFKKWKDLLVTMLMLYPLASLVFAGARFAGMAIYAKGGFWWHLVAMVVMALPLFSLPFIARRGGAILTAANGALNKLAENARRPFTEYSREKSAQSAATRHGDDSGVRKDADGNIIGRNSEFRADGSRRNRLDAWRRQTAVDLEGKRQRRKSDIETGKSRFNSNWAESDRRQMGNGAAATQQAIHAKTRAGNVAAEAQNKFAGTTTPIADGSSGVQEMDRQAVAKDQAKKIEVAAGIRQSQNADHRALKRDVVNLESALGSQAQAIKHEAKTSITDNGAGGTIDGRLQAEQEVVDETIAKTDKDNTSTRFNENQEEGFVAIRTAGAVAESDAKIAQDRQNAVIEEAASGAIAEAGSDLELIPEASRAQLAANRIQQTNTADRTASAQREQSRVYREAITKKMSDGSMSPLAVSAGGVDKKIDPVTGAVTYRGATRATANALYKAEQEDTDEVKARVVNMTHDQPAGKRPGIARDSFKTARAANDSVGIRAALEVLMTTGEAGQGKLQEVLEEIGPITEEQLASPEYEAVRDLQQALLRGGVKGFSIAADKWAVMGGKRTLKEMQADPQWYSGLKEPEFAQQSNAEFINAFSNKNLTAKRAKEVRDHPQSILSEGKRDLLTAVSEGKIPEGADLKYDGELGRFKYEVGKGALGESVYTVI